MFNPTYRALIALEAVRNDLVFMTGAGFQVSPLAPDDIAALVRVPWERNQFAALYHGGFIDRNAWSEYANGSSPQPLVLTTRGLRRMRDIYRPGRMKP